MEREKYFPNEENSEEIKKDEKLETTKKEKDQENQVMKGNENNEITEEKSVNHADAEDAIDLAKVEIVLDEKTLLKIKDFFSQTPDIESNNAEAEKKIMDITSNDAVYHTAPVRSLFNIINSGKILSYSRRLELEKIYKKNQEHGVEVNGHYKLETQYGLGNLDLISCTKINKKGEPNYIEKLGKTSRGAGLLGTGFNPNFVSFVFSYAHSKNKFTNIATDKHHRMDRRGRPQKYAEKISNGPVAGMWPGEIMAKGNLSLKECYGLVFGEKFSSLTIEEFEILTIGEDKKEQEKIFNREHARKLKERKLFQEGIALLQKYIEKILSILTVAEYTNITLAGDGKSFRESTINIQKLNGNKFFDGIITNIQPIDDSLDNSFKKLFSEIENEENLLGEVGCIYPDYGFDLLWGQVLDLKKQQDSPDFSKQVVSFFISFIGRLWHDSIKLKILSQEESSKKYSFNGSMEEWMNFAEKTLKEKLDSILKTLPLESFRHAPSLECKEILNMLDAIKEVRGNITIGELMTQIGQKLQIPVYTVDEKATNFSLYFPEK